MILLADGAAPAAARPDPSPESAPPGAGTPARRRVPTGAPDAPRRGARLRVAVLAGLLALALPGGAQAQGAPGPARVGTIEIRPEAVPYTNTLPGRAVAYEQADIRPRVEGLVEEILYTPGRPLRAGDPLFRLERASYEATATAAEAELSRARGAAEAARVTLDRYRRLQGSGVTAEDVQTAQVALLQAEAEVKSSEAALKIAQLDLARTEIVSPIDGIPSVPAVTVGALVTANQTEVLATVTRLDPIFVDVSESSARMLRIREQMDRGSLQRGERIGMALTLENGATYDGIGELVAPGVIVSPTTATRNLRLQFPNREGLILPGQFLRVTLTLGTTQAMLVPQRATSRSSTGALTAFVVEDGRAARVTLTEAGTYRNAWIVTNGVDAGDLVIVDGLKTLQAGDAVTAVPAMIDENGVVRDLPAATGDGADPGAATGPGAAATDNGGNAAPTGSPGSGATGPDAPPASPAASDPAPSGPAPSGPATSAPAQSGPAASDPNAEAAPSSPGAPVPDPGAGATRKAD